ncbi:App1 family protein [Nocardioides donggukensis]|uniref:DUF2183 domain-containing protein n=1 Tax=Nocardioides donggukensis TaxID=2774019 RepID=A0A927K549_9ACTN|nr:phosphatase domain-containing protein [Nocardioides donggukensis]MBD8868046.1 DUF2183 domain-containing protein [Nocardioides donggukensis]
MRIPVIGGDESPLEWLQRRAKSVTEQVERRIAAARDARVADEPPEHFRIETYLGHGGAGRVVVRGRVLDNDEPPEAVVGEGTGAAVRRTLSRFLARPLPGVRLRVRLAGHEVETESDGDGYFDLAFDLDASTPADGGSWLTGEVALAAPYRGLTGEHAAPLQVRVPGPVAAFGVISDVDDTILHTGAQRAAQMVLQTFTGSYLTRTPFLGSPELYRSLAAQPGHPDANPFFYVSSSPWNLHGFLTAFLAHRDFPLGPLLLRDLLGRSAQRSHTAHKLGRIREVLETHPDLPFVLIGDSGQHDPEIYAEVVRTHPGRVRAVYIREVRLDPGDGRVEAVLDDWDGAVPFVVAADSLAVARHAAELGLVTDGDVHTVERATALRG